MSKDKKVYPQEISPIYRYKPDQLNRKMGVNVDMEVHQRNKLYIFTHELLRWRVLLDNLYRQEQLSKKRLNLMYS